MNFEDEKNNSMWESGYESATRAILTVINKHKKWDTQELIDTIKAEVVL